MVEEAIPVSGAVERRALFALVAQEQWVEVMAGDTTFVGAEVGRGLQLVPGSFAGCVLLCIASDSACSANYLAKLDEIRQTSSPPEIDEHRKAGVLNFGIVPGIQPSFEVRIE